MKPAGVALAASLLVAGCASWSPLGLGVGTGLSSGELFRRAQARVLAADQAAAPDCTERRVLRTEVVEGSRAGETAYDALYLHGLPGNDPRVMPAPSAARTLEQARWVERWVVDRCGRGMRYRVTFAPGKAREREIEVVPEP